MPKASDTLGDIEAVNRRNQPQLQSAKRSTETRAKSLHHNRLAPNLLSSQNFHNKGKENPCRPATFQTSRIQTERPADVFWAKDLDLRESDLSASEMADVLGHDGFGTSRDRQLEQMVIEVQTVAFKQAFCRLAAKWRRKTLVSRFSRWTSRA